MSVKQQLDEAIDEYRQRGETPYILIHPEAYKKIKDLIPTGVLVHQTLFMFRDHFLVTSNEFIEKMAKEVWPPYKQDFMIPEAMEDINNIDRAFPPQFNDDDL